MSDLKFGLVGTGNMGKIYAQIICQSPFLELTAIVGNTKAKTDELVKRFGGTSYYNGNYEKMLNEHNEIDAVIVATPEWIRIEPVRACTHAGKHILIEKPLAASIREAKEVFSELAGYPYVAMPCHTLRFAPQFASAYQSLINGEIGDICHFASKRSANKKLAKRVCDKINPCYWLSPHDIDLMRWFSGDEIEWVTTYQREGMPPLENYIIAHFHFKSGIDAQHLVSWCMPVISGVAPLSIFEVFGTKGMIVINDNAIQSLLFNDENQVKSLDTSYAPLVHDQLVGGFQNTVDHFVKCISEKIDPILSIRDALESVRVSAAMEKSLKEKRVVYLEEI